MYAEHVRLLQPTQAPPTEWERPPPGLSRGKYHAPRWAIFALGAVLLVAGLAYLVLRLRRAKRLAEGARGGRGAE